MEDHLHPARLLAEHRECVVLGRARVDHQRLTGLARELDVGGKRPLLIGPGRAIAVIVKPGLPDRHAALVACQRAQLGEVGVVESGRLVRVPPDRGVDLREVIRSLQPELLLSSGTTPCRAKIIHPRAQTRIG